jgi:hypothetical protein
MKYTNLHEIMTSQEFREFLETESTSALNNSSIDTLLKSSTSKDKISILVGDSHIPNLIHKFLNYVTPSK